MTHRVGLSVLLLTVPFLDMTLTFADPAPIPSPTPMKTHLYKDQHGIAMTECYDEIPEIAVDLDTIWLSVQMAEKVEKIRPASKRPKVCFIKEPMRVTFTDGQPGLLYGYWNMKEILVAVTDDGLECNLIHEYIHALFGPGHDGFKERMNAAGCVESD